MIPPITTRLGGPDPVLQPARIRRRAFTMIEVVVALAIGALILTGATQFVVSLATDWTFRDEERYFEEHVEGVARFLQFTLNRNQRDYRLEEEQRHPALDYPPNYSTSRDPMVRIHFPDGGPLFFHGLPYSGSITGFFTVEPEHGLVLLWHPDLAEPPASVSDFNFLVISPWFRGIVFLYYNEDLDTWEEEERYRSDNRNQPVTPQRVRLKFRYHDSLFREATLLIPQHENDVLLY